MLYIPSRFSLPITAFHIKVLAAGLMVADHLGFVLELEWLRIVGRFSFPLFVWLLAQGAKHTQDWHRYQQRLLILAIATQPVYSLFVVSFLPLNPVFQLWLGLVLVKLIQKNQLTPWLGLGLIGTATLFVDYGYYGILLVLLIASYPHLFPQMSRPIKPEVNVILWFVAFVVLHGYFAWSHPLQIYALPFVILMPLLNRVRERGPRARWFYWFYPLHFVPLIIFGVYRCLIN